MKIILFIKELVHQENVTAELLENDMRRIRIENKELEEKRDALKAMVKAAI